MKIPPEHAKHFNGKICSIFTTPINRDFQQENPNRYPQQIYQYFVGVVQDVNEHGVLLQQAVGGLMTWIALPHIIAIAEEEVEYLTEDDVKVVENPHSVQVSDVKGQFPNEFPDMNKDDPRMNVDALQQIADLVKRQPVTQFAPIPGSPLPQPPNSPGKPDNS